MTAFGKTTASLSFGIIGILISTPLKAEERKPPVQIAGEIGFANLYHPDKPSPFTFDLSEAIAPIEGRVRVVASAAQNGDNTYELPLSISPGSHKRWQLTLPSVSGNGVKVQVADRANRVLAEQDFFGVKVSPRSSLVVVVQDRRGGHFVLPRRPNEEAGMGIRTANLLPEFLPDDPLAYAAVAAILWRSDDPKALNPGQAAALLHWLKLGGLLVVAGGRAVPPGLPDEFHWPGRWEEMRPFPLSNFADASLLISPRPLTLAAATSKVAWEKPILPSADVAMRPLAGGDVPTRIRLGGTRLATEQIVGGGVLIQLAFDPADLSAQGLTLGFDFWDSLLCLPEPRPAQWVALDWLAAIGQDTNHRRLAEAAHYTVASVWRISWVFGVFFLLFFVVNFAFFRKSRRYEWAWLILIVASIGLFLYNRAFGRVGGFGPTRQIELTRSYGVAGEKNLLHFTHMGLLAPRVRQELIAGTQPHQMLLGFDTLSRVVQVLPERQVFPVSMRAGAFATCASVSAGQLPGEGVGMQWSRTDSTLRVTLTNKTGLNLNSPRLYPNMGASMVQSGEEFVLTIPVNALGNWVRGGMGRKTEADPNDWSNRMALGRRGWYNLAVADPDELQMGPLEFRFELPDDKISPITSTGARDVTCKRSVRLLIPVPVLN